MRKKRQGVFPGLGAHGSAAPGELPGGQYRTTWPYRTIYDCIYCAVDCPCFDHAGEHGPAAGRTSRRCCWTGWRAGSGTPEKSILFVQSHVPEVFDAAHTLLSMVTPARVADPGADVQGDGPAPPGQHQLRAGSGYPVLMTADIVIYKADTVPVGAEDQVCAPGAGAGR